MNGAFLFGCLLARKRWLRFHMQLWSCPMIDRGYRCFQSTMAIQLLNNMYLYATYFVYLPLMFMHIRNHGLVLEQTMINFLAARMTEYESCIMK